MGLASDLADYLRGYVVIRAAGPDLAAFVNEAARLGVELKKLRRPGPQAMVAHVAPRHFRRLRGPARKNRVRIRVIRRVGAPFWAMRLSRRPGLIAGFVVAAAIVGVLSSRIWAVEVIGAQPPEAAQVRQALERLGLRPGAAKGHIDPVHVEEGLLRVLPDLAWAEVQVVGSVARVEVRQRRDEQRRDLAPGDVVAAVDGLVTQVIPAAGWPVVGPGEVVRRGQVLISGRPPFSAPADARPVRAAGVVYARVWAEGFAETGLEMRLDRPSGRLAWGLLVAAGPWQMRFGAVEPPFRRFRTEVFHGRPPGPLSVVPLRWDRIVHEELESQVFPLDPQQARRIAEERALEQAASALGGSPDVLDRRVTTWEDETGAGQRLVRTRAVIEAIQNIATFVPYPEPPASFPPSSP